MGIPSLIAHTFILSKINYIYYKNTRTTQFNKENKKKDLLKNNLIQLKKRKIYHIVWKFLETELAI